MTDLWAEFRRQLAALEVGPRRRILVACSGGPDSLALLDLMDRWKKETGAFVAVGHVDHGLRGAASRTDANFVRRVCAARSLPVKVQRVLTRRWAAGRGRGMEDAARELRYGALAGIARRFRCSTVMTAHTLDDQVETVFLHLLRGTGPAGLSGMGESSSWPVCARARLPRLLRPLLRTSKKDLLLYLKKRDLSFRLDATNRQPLFLRNRLRPLLRSWEKWRRGFFQRVAQTARILRDEEDFWRERLSLRRKTVLRRLERGPFLRYHVAEQRRRLRHLYGLTRFDVLERVRQFAADGTRGSLDIPGRRVFKTDACLFFSTNRVSHRPGKAGL